MVLIPKYNPVGVCIYCGSDGGKKGLRDEHIVAYSLGGQSYLPKASCEACEDITKKFERTVARTMYGAFRIRENVRTRHPKQRPTHLPANVEHGDITRIVQLPVEGRIAMFPVVNLLAPGYLRIPKVREIGWVGAELSVKHDAPRDRSSWAAYPQGAKIGFKQSFPLDEYAKVLAKIAHAIATAELGLDAFEHWLPPYIKGDDPHLSYLVGGCDEPWDPQEVLHNIQWTVGPYKENPHEYLVFVKIRLFAQLGGPTAVVVAGKSSLEFVERFRARFTEHSGPMRR